MGADDYIVKPFEMKELIARINAVLRRTEIPNDTTKRLTFDKLVIDLDSYELIVDGKEDRYAAQGAGAFVPSGIHTQPGLHPQPAAG